MNKLIRNSIIGAFATASIVGAAFAPFIASAATADAAAVKAEQQPKEIDQLDFKVSQDGYQVMQNVRSARLALFNGDTDGARQFVDKAQHSLDRTGTDEKALRAQAGGDPNLISIDGDLVVSHDYAVNPEKRRHLAVGRDHLKAGRHKEAIEQLKLADIDVGYSRLRMPLRQTRQHVAEAARLIDAQKYFDANLALKDAEDGLSVDTVTLVEVPKPAKTVAAEAPGTPPAKPETSTN